MSFRRRTVLLAAGAVAAAVAIASVTVYVVTRNQLRGQVDASLSAKLRPGPDSVQIRAAFLSNGKLATVTKEIGTAQASGLDPFGGEVVTRARRQTAPAPGATSGHQSASGGISAPVGGRLQGLPPGPAFLAALPPAAKGNAVLRVELPRQKLGATTGYAQLVQPDGHVVRPSGSSTDLPVTAATRAVAAGRRNAFFSTLTVARTQLRMLTEQAFGGGGALQVTLPLTETNRTLGRLRLLLGAVSLGGIALAALFGLLVSRAALAPVRRLTAAAERVARTQDLGHRIDAADGDELGRLARSFNTMLAALGRSRLAQRQLVSDASHELRTPLTSVRANLDVLAMGDALSSEERARVVAAARSQLRELTVLVGDLVDLSKTDVDPLELEEVRLDLAAAGAVQRARPHAPRCRIELAAAPCLVSAAPARLDRAITNLLHNAIKWGPAEGPVEVSVRDGLVQVRDHGPGIAEADLPRIFDRFYRASAARSMPGSGLGLAIVRQVAETHGGSVHAANDPGGGAVLTLELPPLQPGEVEPAASALEAAIASPERRNSRAVHELPPVR